jgi:ATP-grasp domain, R2K clade family 3
MKAIILRRPRLGRTSCREIRKMSTQGVVTWRNDNKRRKLSWINRNLQDLKYVIRWGCVSGLPPAWGEADVLNTIEAITEVNNKLEFRQTLDNAQLSTSIITTLEGAENFLNTGAVMVVRPAKHAQGKHLHVVRSYEEFLHAVRQINASTGLGWYGAPLIDKIEEYRVFVVSGRAVCVAKKTPGNPQDIAWNVARGGRFDNIRWEDWPLKVVKYAIRAFNLTKLDFGGVDVMVSRIGEVHVLEINSAPSLTSPYRQECMSKAFDYIIERGKENIPLITERGGYTKFIHPCIANNAQLGVN